MNCSELLDNIGLALADDKAGPATRNKIMHETLVMTCGEALKDSPYGFGDLNSQVETIIRRLHIPHQEANAIRRMRRNSNGSKDLSKEQRECDAAALAGLVCRVFGEPLPAAYTAGPPHNRQYGQHRVRANSPDKRCVVKTYDEETITVVVDEDGEETLKTVCYTREMQYANMGYLHHILRTGMSLNLLDCRVSGNTITPRLIVVEPDFLFDISAIAACFEDYGHHPLLYLVGRMREKPNSQAILLGNFVSDALDDIINNPRADIAHTLVRNFKSKALEYATCPDFDPVQFKHDAAAQYANLRQIVDRLQQEFGLDKAILEPSFVCEKLGLRGRVDLMTTDLNLLVEQKSGRNILLERNIKNEHGSLMIEKHYVQLLLYYGIFFNNFDRHRPDIRLLYSKYPLPRGLMIVADLMKLFYEAIRFRNEAVALELDMLHNGPAHILPMLTAETLNTNGMEGFFYERYLRPKLDDILAPLHRLKPLEHAYFCRMMQFVIRENYLSKVGVAKAAVGSVANLWNMPLAEKRETGNIYTGLSITGLKPSGDESDSRSYDLVTLSIPTQGTDFLPNFRRGDMVCLYAYPESEVPDIRKAMVFRGALSEILPDRITVKLSNGQQNRHIFNMVPYYNLHAGDTRGADGREGQRFAWCIEHDGSDAGGGAGIRSLYEFVTAPDDRKALLLGRRAPRRDEAVELSRSYDPRLDPMLLKAKQARDYFLLVGPPGTGKTSRALRFIVEESLCEEQPSMAGRPEPPAVLLLSYTNRAVDEICSMLLEAGIDFIRIGNELSCAPRFRPYLMSSLVGNNPKLDDMRHTMLEARVVVGTTSMIQSRPFVFSLKHFSLAVVDESSQILEPAIIGLLASHREGAPHQGNSGCNIEKFILIGDYKQLPAVVRQSDRDAVVTEPELQAIGLKDCKSSLFERLIRLEQQSGREDFVGTLRYQGRMHPGIADFASTQFYLQEGLRPVPLPHQQEQTIGYTAPSEDRIDDLLKQHRMLFFGSKSCRRPDISDKVNTEEAAIVADLLCRIYRFTAHNFDPDKTVGVIVPYRNQIAMIRREIEKRNIAALKDISIDTVERYQGSQRDVIIYSLTIQHQYQLDFLTANTFEEDGQTIDRKLNVAITRARKQLILTGNIGTLRHNAVYRALIDYFENAKALFHSYKTEK